MSTKKRLNPTTEVLEWRKSFLANLRLLAPREPHQLSSIALSYGNSKIGRKGDYFESAFVWNLPSVVTCPGSSEWCRTSCYNADTRVEKFPVSAWVSNWWGCLFREDYVFDTICRQLSYSEKPCALRIHSSGDFFSVDYIKFWKNIVIANPDVKFWTYTRSWSISDLAKPLETLKDLDNIQIFASVDPTMSSRLIPSGWRRAYVLLTEDEAVALRKSSQRPMVVCPEQTGKVPNCASCGLCMSDNPSDIAFLFH